MQNSYYKFTCKQTSSTSRNCAQRHVKGKRQIFTTNIVAHYIQDIRVLGKDGCWIDGKGFVPLENIFKTDFNNILQVYWIFLLWPLVWLGLFLNTLTCMFRTIMFTERSSSVWYKPHQQGYLRTCNSIQQRVECM